jgi:hypothetical protein
MSGTETIPDADQARERLNRQVATFAAFAIPRSVCGEALQGKYGGMPAEELEQIAEGWRSVLRHSFAARLRALKG